MIHSIRTLEYPDRRFNALKPRLLKCTMHAIENLQQARNLLAISLGEETEAWQGY